MKKTVTYGVYGLMEWHALLNVGKCCIHVDFTGGALSGYGVTPAEFTTSDPVIQHVIESSGYFKSGKIKVLRASEDKTENNAADKKYKILGHSGIGTDKESFRTQVAVTCLDDAKEYLVENHGIAASKLRSMKNIVETAASLGIEFNGI